MPWTVGGSRTQSNVKRLEAMRYRTSHRTVCCCGSQGPGYGYIPAVRGENRWNAIRLAECAVPELPIYPTVLSLAVALAALASAFAGLPFAVALVLIVSGVVLAWFCGYRPRAPAQPGNPIQSSIRRYVARIFRLAIGAALIGLATVGALLAVR
jgi:hypothetical protein